MTLHVVVVGAGIVGAACAIELLRDGHRVTVVEPDEPGGEQAASHGNGAWFSPSSVVPMSMPGLWRQVPGYLLDRSGPLTIRWASLPALMPWLWRFLRAGFTVAKVEATAHALAALLHDAPARHAALAAEAGVPELVARDGLLYAYVDRAAFEADALGWSLRRVNGIVWQELEGEALRAKAPHLDARYTLGLFVPAGGHCRDPGAYVRALFDHATARGAQWRRTRARGFAQAGGRLRAVLTDDGEIAADRAVIAAGIASASLARAVGDPIPLASERGYHVELPRPGVEVPVPVQPADGKMANTMTHGGLRVAGQVELAAVSAPPDWRRADILLRHARRAYPGLRTHQGADAPRRWLGHRPSTPDGLPVLGPAQACGDVFHAFGHGHVGLAAGPASARLVADLIAGRAPQADPRPYRAGRFRG